MHNHESAAEIKNITNLDVKYNLVMLIDDNRIDNFISRNIVKNCSFAEFIKIHTGGQTALDFLRALQAGQSHESTVPPDFIFVDLNMPEMNGLQFMAEFETLEPDFRKNIKVVMLTSSVSQEDRAAAEKYSCLYRFLNKPLTEKALELLFPT